MSFDTKNLFNIRAVGTALIFASVCEFIIGGIVFHSVTNKHPGGWWGVIVPFIAGTLAFGANTRPYILATLAVTAAGFITALAAVIIDGESTGVIDMSEGCINTETLQVWGSPLVTTSTSKLPRPACMAAGVASKAHQCVCADHHQFCWNYDLAKGDNCGYILHGYYGLLATSTALLTVVLALSLALIYHTSVSLYFPTNDKPSDVKEVALKDGAEYTAAGVEEN